jgi:hypothetical protein
MKEVTVPNLNYHIETPLFCNRLCDECRYRNECDYTAMKKDLGKNFIKKSLRQIGELNINLADLLDGMNESYEAIVGLEPDEARRRYRRMMFSKVDAKADANHFLLIAARDFKKAVYEWMHQDELGIYRQQRTLDLVVPKLEAAIERIRTLSMYLHDRLEQVLEIQDLHGDDPLAHYYINGCARAALDMLDGIISSWQELLILMPEKENSTLGLLEESERLLQIVEKQYPQARAFLRPGLDE